VTSFPDRLRIVEDRIAAACRRAGRPRGEVRLMAVSKLHPPSAIEEAMAAGVTLFGENRVQEFDRKRGSLSAQPEVHLIGHLQSNKAAKAAEIFSGIDTVDSLKLAERLEEAAGKVNEIVSEVDQAENRPGRLPILLEIKLSHEETKEGLDPAGLELRTVLERAPEFAHLEVRGLMTVAPLDEDAETARACFRDLHALRNQLSQDYPRLSLGELSMGMSGDFELAIEQGSTLVRIGTALFGAREPH
jgi:pyridoxal phosphate enzyme (YggS family)